MFKYSRSATVVPVDRRNPGEARLLVRVGHERPVCAEGAGVARNENATDAQRHQDRPGNAWPRAANGTSVNSRDRSRAQR